MYPREGRRSAFLADLTTSEGQLHRFTGIAHIMRPEGLMETDMLVPLIQKNLGLTNIKVIRRHLRAMESLGLLAREEVGYVLSSEGKALCALAPAKSNKELALAEKIFYLRALGSYVPLQLRSILAAISENAGAPKEQAITSYGQKILASGVPWKNKHVLRLALSKHPDLPPRTIRNNFECFRRWTEQLQLVDPSPRDLTKLGNRLVHIMKMQEDQVREEIYRTAAVYICHEPGCLPDYEDSTDRPRFLQLLREAYRLFERRELRLSDARAISPYVCIKLLIEGDRILPEKTFWDLIKKLINEGLIQSAMTGRDGKIAYISLGVGARY